jgi:hypothetical protein
MNGHFMTALRAFPARFGALVHQRIVAATESFATAGATIADLGAKATRFGMQIRLSQDEIGRGQAHFSTILHQADMIRGGMLAALFEAILNGLDTHGVATGALLNTRFEIGLGQHVFPP